jgi:hypothetical protein
VLFCVVDFVLLMLEMWNTAVEGDEFGFGVGDGAVKVL